ncbi:unnamed protein product, partial [marine sediment metagenome]
AKALLSRDRTDMGGILGRRAAVVGLGLIGTREAVPILMAAWHLNHYVNREVALSFSLSRVPSVAEPLVKLLNDKIGAEAFAAHCLGELFLTDRPGRLTRLIRNGNYMMKNERLMPYQRMANEFLYRYLIAAFGEEWR